MDANTKTLPLPTLSPRQAFAGRLRIRSACGRTFSYKGAYLLSAVTDELVRALDSAGFDVVLVKGAYDTRPYGLSRAVAS